MKFTIQVEREDSAAPVVIGEIERTEPWEPGTLGMRLAEAKAVLARLQEAVVQWQVRAHVEVCRVCAQCGRRREVKDYRQACVKSLFGGVPLRVPASV
jgi:hypothetical protein